MLKSAGFSQVKSVGQLEGQTFCEDIHCWDILVFPALLKAQLYSTKLLSEHKLIIQVQAPQKDFLRRATSSLLTLIPLWKSFQHHQSSLIFMISLW